MGAHASPQHAHDSAHRPHFVMVDSVGGLQVLSYTGQLLSQPRFAGMRPSVLSPLSVAYAADLLAVVASAAAKVPPV